MLSAGGSWRFNTLNLKGVTNYMKHIQSSYPSSTDKCVKINIMKSSEENSPKEGLHLLCFDLSHVSSTVQFTLLCVGVFVFYLIYGYFQELIFQLEGFKHHGWYLTLIQFACYTVFGLSELQFKQDKKRRIPLKTYSLIALLTVATMGLSNTSVGYLNYPTQVIFKCCKLIPVLIGGILIQGKKYGLLDVVACVCMSLGLILFTLADNSISPSFNSYGVLLISLALCADACIGNFQEKAMKQFSGTSSEMVLYSYSIGFVYILCGLVISGDFVPAFAFCWEHPLKTYGYAVIFSLSGYLGVNIVLSLVKSFGALVAVTVTTCRKAVTIILSFIFFTKPFTSIYIWSGLIVVLGIYLNIYSKNKTKWDAYLKNCVLRLGLVRRRKVTVQSLENIV